VRICRSKSQDETADAHRESRHKEFRDKQAALHEAWVQQKKEHDEKVARGEKVEKLGPDPTAEHEIGLVGLLKFLAYVALFALLAGKFFTGSYLWEYESKWTQLKTYWPVRVSYPVDVAISLLTVQHPRRTSACFLNACWPRLTVPIQGNRYTWLWVSRIRPDVQMLTAITQIDRDVYDVSGSRHTYGPGGSYHLMSDDSIISVGGVLC
jgi:hypothetical protein